MAFPPARVCAHRHSPQDIPTSDMLNIDAELRTATSKTTTQQPFPYVTFPDSAPWCQKRASEQTPPRAKLFEAHAHAPLSSHTGTNHRLPQAPACQRQHAKSLPPASGAQKPRKFAHQQPYQKPYQKMARAPCDGAPCQWPRPSPTGVKESYTSQCSNTSRKMLAASLWS